MTDPRDVATTYFESWKGKDFDTLRSLLRDDVTFRGPLGVANSADECVAGLQKMAEGMSDLIVLKMAADGNDVLTWFDLHMKGAPVAPTVNWQHIEDGKIARIRVTFDPRAILEHSTS
jgi:limonene-1,2-epoxide hydrolase